MKNGCPVCRNLNDLTATQCRYCGAALTPPQPPAPAAHRRPRWPFAVGGIVALVIVVAGGAFAFGGSAGSAPVGPATTIQAGTDTGAALKFDPAQLTAPPNAPLQVVFTNKAQVPHNMTFQDPINTKTADQVPPGQSATLTFTSPGPGTYKFVCTIHPGMEGTLTVK